MDARIDPTSAFGIDLGAAHVIRNAGGNARDAVRSIAISNHLLNTTEVLVVKHTDCGMLTFQNSAARGAIEKNLEGKAGVREAVDKIDFQPFPDLDQAVKDDVEFLQKENVLVKDGTNVSGWVYDVRSGKVRQVV